MSFYAKLFVFWIVVHIVYRLALRYPGSRLSRIAFSWHGPVPHHGELKSHFLARRCAHALAWLSQILFVFACGYCISFWFPSVAETTPFLVVWFVVSLLGGMALLGAAIAACASLKARYFGPDPTFEAIVHEPEAPSRSSAPNLIQKVALKVAFWAIIVAFVVVMAAIF
jgi:hypothetical protein